MRRRLAGGEVAPRDDCDGGAPMAVAHSESGRKPMAVEPASGASGSSVSVGGGSRELGATCENHLKKLKDTLEYEKHIKNDYVVHAIY
jgi:hypothetical protein